MYYENQYTIKKMIKFTNLSMKPGGTQKATKRLGMVGSRPKQLMKRIETRWRVISRVMSRWIVEQCSCSRIETSIEQMRCCSGLWIGCSHLWVRRDARRVKLIWRKSRNWDKLVGVTGRWWIDRHVGIHLSLGIGRFFGGRLLILLLLHWRILILVGLGFGYICSWCLLLIVYLLLDRLLLLRTIGHKVIAENIAASLYLWAWWRGRSWSILLRRVTWGWWCIWR